MPGAIHELTMRSRSRTAASTASRVDPGRRADEPVDQLAHGAIARTAAEEDDPLGGQVA